VDDAVRLPMVTEVWPGEVTSVGAEKLYEPETVER
jgi:hypothetical protein